MFCVFLRGWFVVRRCQVATLGEIAAEFDFACECGGVGGGPRLVVRGTDGVPASVKRCCLVCASQSLCLAWCVAAVCDRCVLRSVQMTTQTAALRTRTNGCVSAATHVANHHRHASTAVAIYGPLKAVFAFALGSGRRGVGDVHIERQSSFELQGAGADSGDQSSSSLDRVCSSKWVGLLSRVADRLFGFWFCEREKQKLAGSDYDTFLPRCLPSAMDGWMDG